MNDHNDNVRDLLVHGIAAAKAKSNDEARFYLEWVLRTNADHEQMRDAWMWLGRVKTDLKEKRHCFEQGLAYDPSDPELRRELAILDGRLNPADIVDPDRMPAPAASSGAPTRRFVCAQCGGKMSFTPDGNALTCEYCGKRQSLADLDNTLIAEQDFLIALATAKGHTQPTMQRAFACASCGASFVLAPATISLKCPYCETAYAVEKTETRELIEPAGVVPFAITLDRALRAELKWFREAGYELRGDPVPPTGVYVPAWTFDLGGEIEWNCLVEEQQMDMPGMNSRTVWRKRNGSRVIYENDLLVCATHTLNATLLDALNEMPLAKLAPFDPRFLADFPAETYQINVGDASLVARSRVHTKTRQEIEASIFETYQDLTASTAHLVIESYKLILVPLWIAHYKLEDVQRAIVINGHTGALRAEKPQSGIGRWFADLLS
ncbi:MAG: hypothetical protein HY868_15710 [Chloroflexi bacterium]|nr:hypothetical protein [Chloroflexota bacterium]